MTEWGKLEGQQSPPRTHTHRKRDPQTPKWPLHEQEDGMRIQSSGSGKKNKKTLARCGRYESGRDPKPQAHAPALPPDLGLERSKHRQHGLLLLEVGLKR